MQLNKLFKTMCVVIPLLGLGACVSTSESETSTSDGEIINADGSEYGSENSSGIEMGGVNPILTPEEQQRQQEEELRRDNNIIYFDFDRSEVQTEYEQVLQAHGEYLVENPSVTVLIEGHADERGTPEYNIALGERRAKAVSKYLQGMGVQPSQMTVVSYGEEKPLDPSHTEASFTKNRRAELIY